LAAVRFSEGMQASHLLRCHVDELRIGAPTTGRQVLCGKLQAHWGLTEKGLIDVITAEVLRQMKAWLPQTG